MQPGFLSRIIHGAFPCLALALLLTVRASAQTNATGMTNSLLPPPSTNKVVLPSSVPDPFEPFNRGSWALNRVLLADVVRPTARGYRLIVRKPVRTSIGNFGRNIAYPVRLLNNLLQGKWSGARDETDRFMCNTFVGCVGFMDVATTLKIPKSDADFGQTLGQWGWRPQVFLMLPIYGPSNERDTIGLAADTAANPLTYISPYSFDPTQMYTYFSPYTYWSYSLMYNNLTDTVDDFARFAETEQDPYSEIQYAWTFVRENRVADFRVKGKQDPSSLETLETVFFKPKDPEFSNRGKTRSVYLPSTHREMKYTVWMQKEKAAVVYIVPGLGSHRLADTAVALAELVFDQGYSVVNVSSPYNYEFMREASTAAMPAYTPVDVHDLHVGLTTIHHKLERIYPGQFGDKALMGYSMGAFESLFLAGVEQTNKSPLIKFDRYVGINTPVRLLYGVSKLDEFYNAPMMWPASERNSNLENTFLKVAGVTQNSFTPSSTLPFDAVESKFLIGLVFRLNLRDIIFTSQERHNMGILRQPVNLWRREPVYDEILQYSYQDYFQKFVIPYYKKRGIDLGTGDTLEKASNLRTYASSLAANPNIRLMVNRNDFLLPPEDLEWLQSILPPEHLHIFEEGGHLGNLANPNVQKTIVGMLDGLQPVAPKTPTPKSSGPAKTGPVSLP
ncbi:MAG TPA: VacJ family lipoprotein [Verrucomicrobiae bacterium]|nr:VacJ family lipoprotein [Verrucomicrobiae bacterium]